MKTNRSIIVVLAVLLTVTAARASTLKVSFEHHIAVVESDGDRKLLRTRFTDEPVIANVKLDVYALPQMPSTRAHLDELQRLTEGTWLKALRWSVLDARNAVRDVQPRLVKATRTERTDTTVPCVTYAADFDFSGLPPGDYTVQATIAGLESNRFPLAVRAGTESDVRDVYLREKAQRSRNWEEIKSLQLERVRLNPTKAGALLDLAHGALEFGTLAETRDYFERAAVTMEQNIANWAKRNPEDAKKQAPSVEYSVRQIRALQRVLPEYFANRAAWRVAIDSGTGRYVIRARRTNEVIREVR